MEMPELLVIDDEPEMLRSYEKLLAREGFHVRTFSDAEKALAALSNGSSVNLVLCDMKMPGMDGLAFLSIARERHPHVPVIMVTGYGTVESALEAVRRGAFDFIEKPFTRQKLLGAVREAMDEIRPGQADATGSSGFDEMIGQHPKMRRMFDLINRISFGNANVLITGESGVGKELVARSIHKRSMRRNRQLIPINCSALPESLFESELFGYEKGAFTGAFQSKPGLVELANGGTLFLDELCEMAPGLQAKLLRVLEERHVRRIGGKTEIPVDIRVVSATNRDIQSIVSEGKLREDLLYRVNTIQVHIPPLRERDGDIPTLARHFLESLNAKYGRDISRFDEEAIALLCGYAWPGNVRELQNTIERAYYLANPPAVRVADLPQEIAAAGGGHTQPHWHDLEFHAAKEQAVERFEREYLSYHLDRTDWNVSEAARVCGVDRRTLHRLIKRYDLGPDS
jgi:two-component system response regulator AtoC